MCWGARGVLICTVQGRGGSYIVIRNMMAAFRETGKAGFHVQLHINAHAANAIESHMRSPLVFHIILECLGSLYQVS